MPTTKLLLYVSFLVLSSAVVACQPSGRLGQTHAGKDVGELTDFDDDLQPRVPTDCTPSCSGSCGVDDGCGGVCGCDINSQCGSSGKCVAPDLCSDSCESVAWQCGSLCGQACGSCAGGQQCYLGTCIAPTTTNSLDSSLQLTARNVSDTAFDVEVSYRPELQDVRPNTVDLRVRVSKKIDGSLAASLRGVTAGEVLTKAEKQFFTNPTTGKAWTLKQDNVYQFLILSFERVEPWSAGHVATLHFNRHTTREPVSVNLVEHTQTFAPYDAERSLRAKPFNAPIHLVK